MRLVKTVKWYVLRLVRISVRFKFQSRVRLRCGFEFRFCSDFRVQFKFNQRVNTWSTTVNVRSTSAPVQDSVRPESTRVNSVGSRFGSNRVHLGSTGSMFGSTDGQLISGQF
ncbi:hypothetical protein HanPSC8_Chr17g0792671 [Helianthus annuus]|nr:hypothetical protein HanPSC8_Chr17g0792671 [Helianthus annuus]